MSWQSSSDRSTPPYAWHIALTHPSVAGPGCRPTVVERYVYADSAAAATGDYSSYERSEYAGACACGWRGEPTASENGAVESAHGHAWPGWEQLPVLPRLGYEPTPEQRAEYIRLIDHLYPAGWRGGAGRSGRCGPVSVHATCRPSATTPGATTSAAAFALSGRARSGWRSSRRASSDVRGCVVLSIRGGRPSAIA
jgi:hypothetical protein